MRLNKNLNKTLSDASKKEIKNFIFSNLKNIKKRIKNERNEKNEASLHFKDVGLKIDTIYNEKNMELYVTPYSEYITFYGPYSGLVPFKVVIIKYKKGEC